MPFSFLLSGSVSDRGRKRSSNEDAILDCPEHGLFCVADGMGGLHAGEVASSMVVEKLLAHFQSTENPCDYNFEKSVLSALDDANTSLREFARKEGISGTGTTVVVLAFDPKFPGRAIVFHAGDSRVYRLRGEKLDLLTRDHSLVSALGVEDTNMIPMFFRGMITNAIGLDRKPEIEKTTIEVLPGDLFLLCSDGLTRMLSDELLFQLMHRSNGSDMNKLAELLVAQANQAGGDDNVSVVIVKDSRIRVE